ncbi:MULTISPECIES: hypothetical protein [unclassified Streptomyces]|uniref:hypothetical protein n=1 Tax=unclassified Streptomyces TaxID=2593676 RepID=UPI00332B0EC4
MANKPSQPRHGEGPSRHQGDKQHGWSPDVDEESQQSNPSAHRSFHPDTYAPEADEPRRASTKEEKQASEAGTPVDSMTTSGEDRDEKSEGMHDTGRRGKSQRPSGEKDASAYSGVDPQESTGKDGSR